MIARLFRRAEKAAPPPASIPAGERVYAIGDVHGRLDLLTDLLTAIDADDTARGAARTTLIFLGDLVDRGPDSAGVVEAAMAQTARTDRATRFILGNHEEMFIAAARGKDRLLRTFVRNGGRETILSYGMDAAEYDALDFPQLAQRLLTQIPRSHVDFVADFEPSVRVGDYLFVHAGVRPGVALDAQKDVDLRWIRDDFLDDRRDHGAVVVHGHTIAREPEDRGNRIGIDTGGYLHGRLTALGLEGTDRWFLHAEGEAHPDWAQAGWRG